MAFREPVNFALTWRLMRLSLARRVAHWFVSWGQVEAVFRRYMFSAGYPHARERLELFWQNLRRENGAEVFVAYFNGWTDREFAMTEAAYGGLAMPALILWGKKDAFFPLEQAEKLKRAIGHARLEVYPGGSHSIVEENVAKTAADVVTFLRGLEPWS
jgi:pimeloyl-ACP methyl ester carboxylesterase